MIPSRKISNGLYAFIPAAWRGVTSVNPKTGTEIGVSFDVEAGETVRLLLTVESARNAALAILDQIAAYEFRTATHSASSVGNLNSDGSPQEGQNV